MVDWVLKHIPSESKPAILEIGSGNGALLFALVEGGYDPEAIVGIDYSSDAVQLARLVGAGKGCQGVRFKVCDFLREEVPPAPRPGERWDLVLDKGTFDAIALGEREEDGRSPAAHYPERVVRLLKDGGFFLITSCNFTEEELKSAFTQHGVGLVYHSRVQHPTFTFGGRSGSMYATVAFQKPNAIS